MGKKFLANVINNFIACEIQQINLNIIKSKAHSNNYKVYTMVRKMESNPSITHGIKWFTFKKRISCQGSFPKTKVETGILC